MPAEEQVALVRRACAGSALQWVAVSQDLRLLTADTSAAAVCAS